MSVRKRRKKSGAVYFATFTCFQWLPLFEMVNGYDVVYNWMHLAHSKGYRFFGYVIMPNHAHFIIRVPEDGAINTALGNGKRFMAYEIIEPLTAEGRNEFLEQLRAGMRPSDVAHGQKRRVFATSTDLVECSSGKKIKEWLKYIPANRVNKSLVPP